MCKQILACLSLDENMGSVDPEQPVLLDILQGLAEGTRDPDTSLIQHWRQGVPTGCFEPIPDSGVFRYHEDEQGSGHLQECWLNWETAEQNTEATDAFIQVAVQEGFVSNLGSDITAVLAKCPRGIAIGKLNRVRQEGKADRLVLGSTVPGVNPMAVIHEMVALPTLSSLQQCFSEATSTSDTTAFSIDVKAAHNA